MLYMKHNDTSIRSIIPLAAAIVVAALATGCNPIQFAGDPVFSPDQGWYAGTQDVTISTSTLLTMIYYTTDGSEPSVANGTLYFMPIRVATTTRIRAIAYSPFLRDSHVTEATYFIVPGSVAAPSLTRSGAYVEGSLTVEMSTGTSGTSMRYTTDGSEPTPSHGTLYEGPFTLTENATVKAIAFTSGFFSEVASAQYLFYDCVAFGGPGDGANQFNGPGAVALDPLGRIYVADGGNCRIVRIDDMYGTGWVGFGSSGIEWGQFDKLADVAVDKDGGIYVADMAMQYQAVRDGRIVFFSDMSGAGWSFLGGFGSYSGYYSSNWYYQPYGPYDVAVDAGKRIYVADPSQNRLIRIDDISGNGLLAMPDTVAGVSLDSNGHIYIEGQGIRRMDDMNGSGTVSFVLPYAAFETYGMVGSYSVSAVAAGADGRLYFAYSNFASSLLFRMDDMTGNGLLRFRGNMTGVIVRDLAVGADGSLYMPDAANHRILRLIPR